MVENDNIVKAITMVDFPGSDGTIVSNKGGTLGAKFAKLDNTNKRPYVQKKYKEGRPSYKLANSNEKLVITAEPENTPKDYNSFINNLGITATKVAGPVNVISVKKLRVNRIVTEKASNINRHVEKVDLTPEEQVVGLISQINEVPFKEEVKEEEVRGRHEPTVKIPVDEIKQAVANDTLSVSSRMERNAVTHDEMPKEERPFDWDLYNNKVHGNDDVHQQSVPAQVINISNQLQGAKKENMSLKRENRDLAAETEKIARERDALKMKIEEAKRAKAEKEEKELSQTLDENERLRLNNLEMTSNLTNLHDELMQLRSQYAALAENDEHKTRSVA